MVSGCGYVNTCILTTRQMTLPYMLACETIELVNPITQCTSSSVEGNHF